MHFVGAAVPAATCFLWQSMQRPVPPLGSWKAACRLVFMGGAAGIVWQSPHACCSAARGFWGWLAWWHVAQEIFREIQRVHPRLATYIRVDLSDYSLARG